MCDAVDGWVFAVPTTDPSAWSEVATSICLHFAQSGVEQNGHVRIFLSSCSMDDTDDTVYTYITLFTSFSSSSPHTVSLPYVGYVGVGCERGGYWPYESCGLLIVGGVAVTTCFGYHSGMEMESSIVQMMLWRRMRRRRWYQGLEVWRHDVATPTYNSIEI
jgi:hypothetical protein